MQRSNVKSHLGRSWGPSLHSCDPSAPTSASHCPCSISGSDRWYAQSRRLCLLWSQTGSSTVWWRVWSSSFPGSRYQTLLTRRDSHILWRSALAYQSRSPARCCFRMGSVVSCTFWNEKKFCSDIFFWIWENVVLFWFLRTSNSSPCPKAPKSLVSEKKSKQRGSHPVRKQRASNVHLPLCNWTALWNHLLKGRASTLRFCEQHLQNEQKITKKNKI